MAEYIEREAAMLQINAADFVRDDNFEGGATLLFCDDVVDRLSAIPAADVVERASGIIGVIPAADVRPVVKAKWEWNDNNGYYYCGNCKAVSPREDQDGEYIDCPNFCPNCGADMRAEEGE